MADEQEVFEAFSAPTPRKISDKEPDEEAFYIPLLKKAVMPVAVLILLFIFLPFLRPSIIIFFVVFVGLVGIILTPSFLYWKYEENLIKKGDFAVAKIIEILDYQNYDTGGPWVSSGYTIRFEFSDHTGALVQGEENLTGSEANLFDDMKAGESVIVVYPVGKPEKNQLYAGIPYKPVIPR